MKTDSIKKGERLSNDALTEIVVDFEERIAKLEQNNKLKKITK